jgi:hypothetical protein
MKFRLCVGQAVHKVLDFVVVGDLLAGLVGVLMNLVWFPPELGSNSVMEVEVWKIVDLSQWSWVE